MVWECSASILWKFSFRRDWCGSASSAATRKVNLLPGELPWIQFVLQTRDLSLLIRPRRIFVHISRHIRRSGPRLEQKWKLFEAEPLISSVLQYYSKVCRRSCNITRANVFAYSAMLSCRIYGLQSSNPWTEAISIRFIKHSLGLSTILCRIPRRLNKQVSFVMGMISLAWD